MFDRKDDIFGITFFNGLINKIGVACITYFSYVQQTFSKTKKLY